MFVCLFVCCCFFACHISERDVFNLLVFRLSGFFFACQLCESPQWGTAEWEINGPSCIGNHRSFLWGSTFLNALCLSVSLSYFCLLAHSPDYFHEFLLLIFVFLHLHAGYCVFFLEDCFLVPRKWFLVNSVI